MQIIRRIEDLPAAVPSVVTVGMFDGVHRAHREIIQWTVAEARTRRSRSVVVTFDPHPKEVVGDPQSVELLTTLDERVEQFRLLDVDMLFVIPFDRTFAATPFGDFTKKILVDAIGAKGIVEGYDHHWGKNREGNIDQLRSLGEGNGFTVKTLEPMKWKDRLVNSSTIRTLLKEGRVEEAGDLLGRPYLLRGMVVHGDARGRLLGYPTANLELPTPRKLVPKFGIYFTRVHVDSRSFAGMLSIGIRPTFKTSGQRTIEDHLLDFDEDIYDRQISIEVLEHMRDEMRFDSAETLVLQMKRDEADARKRQYQHKLKS